MYCMGGMLYCVHGRDGGYGCVMVCDVLCGVVHCILVVWGWVEICE